MEIVSIRNKSRFQLSKLWGTSDSQVKLPLLLVQASARFSLRQTRVLRYVTKGNRFLNYTDNMQLKQADLIVSELGNDPQVISAAIGLVAAEQNFNPFVVSIPKICGDPTLPATAALRGVVPLVDPSVGESDVENANSAKSKTAPFSSDGLSVAQVMAANGFTNFTSTTGDSGASGTAASGAASAATPPAVAATDPPTTLATQAAPPCVQTVTVTAAAADSSAADSTTAAAAAAATTASAASSSSGAVAAGSDGAAGVAPGLIKSTIAGLDFGICTPTIKFEAGLDGRKDTEFTFQAQDPLVNKGQEEALNPNIITNRICDQLTNVCNANAAAKSACQAAKAQIAALGTKDASTADAWNTALGFAGTNINPDNAPQPGLIGHS
jgi:hypothetical protein